MLSGMVSAPSRPQPPRRREFAPVHAPSPSEPARARGSPTLPISLARSAVPEPETIPPSRWRASPTLARYARVLTLVPPCPSTLPLSYPCTQLRVCCQGETRSGSFSRRSAKDGARWTDQRVSRGCCVTEPRFSRPTPIGPRSAPLNSCIGARARLRSRVSTRWMDARTTRPLGSLRAGTRLERPHLDRRGQARTVARRRPHRIQPVDVDGSAARDLQAPQGSGAANRTPVRPADADRSGIARGEGDDGPPHRLRRGVDDPARGRSTERDAGGDRLQALVQQRDGGRALNRAGLRREVRQADRSLA